MEEKTMTTHLEDMIENHFYNLRKNKLIGYNHEQITGEQFIEQLNQLRDIQHSVNTLLKQSEEI